MSACSRVTPYAMGKVTPDLVAISSTTSLGSTLAPTMDSPISARESC